MLIKINVTHNDNNLAHLYFSDCNFFGVCLSVNDPGQVPLRLQHPILD